MKASVVANLEQFVPRQERRVRLLQLLNSQTHRLVVFLHILHLGQKCLFLELEALDPVLVLVVHRLKLAQLVFKLRLVVAVGSMVADVLLFLLAVNRL